MSLRAHGYPDALADVDAGPRMPRARSPEAFGGYPIDDGGLGRPQTHAAPDGGVLRKKLYDQSLSDWSARYRKNKQNLETLVKDCEQLRLEVARHQQEVDERAETVRSLEEKFLTEVDTKYQETKSNYEMAMQQKGMLAVQISENRKQKQQLLRDKKMITADYERKHAELMRMTEVRDKLAMQLEHFTSQLGQINRDRQRMERELDEVNLNLKAHSDLADEVNSEIAHVQDGIKDSMDLHMALPSRMEMSTSSRGGLAGALRPGGEQMQALDELVDGH
mmetsp:Transcript_72816/g.201888  ORF Transcript_72816/g.201888 Transcript_72816/m.201888 type:complete len:278 (-) Transcript_72816:146-979(-)